MARPIITPPWTQAEVDNAEAMWARASTAIGANIAYLAVVNPTNAQVAAQVNLLTKETTALIRFLVNAVDTIAGTT